MRTLTTQCKSVFVFFSVNFPDEQLYIIFRYAHAGTALEKFEVSDHRLSAFQQVTASLAAAEEAFEFEHRDLHD